MAKFNYKEIARAVASSPTASKRVNTYYQNRFKEGKIQLLQEFDSNPVTQEIEAGVDATNISQTLGGTSNLFSFIGFPASATPITELRKILEQELTITPGRPTLAGDKIQYKFSLRIPADAIRAATPLPFENGKSWAEGIEKGISGFGKFIQGKFRTSRSGGGIQVEQTVRADSFKPQPYLSEMFRNLIKKAF